MVAGEVRVVVCHHLIAKISHHRHLHQSHIAVHSL